MQRMMKSGVEGWGGRLEKVRGSQHWGGRKRLSDPPQKPARVWLGPVHRSLHLGPNRTRMLNFIYRNRHITTLLDTKTGYTLSHIFWKHHKIKLKEKHFHTKQGWFKQTQVICPVHLGTNCWTEATWEGGSRTPFKQTLVREDCGVKTHKKQPQDFIAVNIW